MESDTMKDYVKPEYKIFLRFTEQLAAYIGKGDFRGTFQSISCYRAYSRYTKRTKAPYEMGLPWISHLAFERLKTLIHSETDILEFGSGGSTMFFKDKVRSVYSIEHDERWFDQIAEQFIEYPQVKLNLVLPEEGADFDQNYVSVNGLFSEGKSYKTYAHAADHLPDESVDLLIIDGRARPQCLQNSISKLKSGGVLIFDNSDRESYKPIIQDLLEGWEKEVYAGVTVYDWQFNETSLFFKP